MRASMISERKNPTTLRLLTRSFFVLLLLVAPTLRGAAPLTIVKDTSRIVLRQPPAEKQEELLADKDYLYDKVPPAPKTPWERFWDWVERKIDEVFSSEGFSNFWDVFQYVLIVAAIGLIIWLLMKNDVRGLFYGKSVSTDIGFKEVSENIHEIDFDKLIEEAVARKDFRRAVRLYFLRVLKVLSDKELIAWKADKTNYDYYLELRESRYQGPFKELSFLYEYIWYGDFGITEDVYKGASEKFKEFNNQVKN